MMMNSSVKVAKQLVRMARMLIAFNRSELESRLKKRSDLKEDKLKEHLDCLEEMDAKEQKVALYWINKKRLILPEDLSKFNEAMNLIDKQHLDFQKFEGPMEVINRNDKSTVRIKSQDIDFSPSSERTFSHPYNAGDGVVIYEVKNSREGQQAVRKAIDANWGYDKNPWCLAARKNGFDQDEIDALPDDQAKELGLYSDDVLAVAWKYWNGYNAYPKRIAFKNGKLLAFSAGNEKQHVQWWDKNDESHYVIPGSNAVDDMDFLKKHGKLNLLDIKNVSPEMIEELMEDKDWEVRYGVARNPNAPVELLMKLAEDEDGDVRCSVAENPHTPVEILRKLAEDEKALVRRGVAENPHTPVELLRKLTEDEDKWVRQKAVENPSAPVEVLRKLAEDKDEDEWVRSAVAENPSTPIEILRKFAEDEDWSVRCGVAENSSAPVEILRKLAGDENWNVRYGVARNPKTPSELLMKLAEDEEETVRYIVADNPRTPAEALRKLADDQDERVKEVARRRLKQQ